MAEKLIKDVKYNITANKTAKQQALFIIKALKSHPEIPMERAPMLIKVEITDDEQKTIETQLNEAIKGFEKKREEKSKVENKVIYEISIDPSAIRAVQQVIDKVGNDKLLMEILSVNQETD